MAGSTLVKIIQEAAKLPTSESTDLLVGTVTSVNPLKVKVDNRYELDKDFLILSTLVRDFKVDMTVNQQTENYTVQLGLSVGEKVLLLRVQSGQKFIIIDRVRDV